MQIWDRVVPGCSPHHAYAIVTRTWLQHNPQRYRRGVEFTGSLLGLVYRGMHACRRFVSLSVGLGDGEYVSSGLYVQFRSVPTVRHIQPISGPASAVGVVKVGGADFVDDEGLCRFDDLSPGVVDRVSSTLIKCEVPDHDIGIVAFELELGDDGQQYTRSGVLYEYVQEPWVVGIEPPQGPLEGGATVKLALHVDHSLSALPWMHRADSGPWTRQGQNARSVRRAYNPSAGGRSRSPPP